MNWRSRSLKSLVSAWSAKGGNVAILTALMAMPLVTLAAGALEYASYTKLRSELQSASDQAVLAGFRNTTLRWRDRQAKVRNIFQANLNSHRSMHSVTSSLSGERMKDRIVLTHKAATTIVTVFGSFNPLAGDRIDVKSVAEWRFTGQPDAKLISSKATVRDR